MLQSNIIILDESLRHAIAARDRAGFRNQAYEAASDGRRLMSWRPSSAGPTATVVHNLQKLRDRSRDAVRNNAWIAHGVDLLVSDEIGTGIVSRSRCSDKQFRLAADRLWPRFVQQADADGVLDYYGLLAMLTRARIESGEAFMRFRPRLLSDGLAVPLQLQLIEADFCPHTYDRPFLNGRSIKAGIEFDAVGHRTAYWMYKGHPGEFDGAIDASTMVAVPAESVLHHYIPLRPGSMRGAPLTTQALIKAKDFDEYDDSELIRKKSRSGFTGVFTRPTLDDPDQWEFDPFSGEPLKRDSKGVPIMQIETGQFVSALPGEDVKLFDGDVTGSGYADFSRQQLLGLSAGLGAPYELISGDMRNVNDRIMRVILNQYHRLIEQRQWQLVIHQVCDPVWKRFVEVAVLAGKLDVPNFDENRDDYLAVEHRTPGWPYIHPVQDVQAKEMDVRNGFTSRSGVAAERGWDSEDIDKQNAEDNARADSLGLVYDSDGRVPKGGGKPDAEGKEEISGV